MKTHWIGAVALVGGAVMDHERAQSLGADGFAPDAARAVDACKVLLGLE